MKLIKKTLIASAVAFSALSHANLPTINCANITTFETGCTLQASQVDQQQAQVYAKLYPATGMAHPEKLDRLAIVMNGFNSEAFNQNISGIAQLNAAGVNVLEVLLGEVEGDSILDNAYAMQDILTMVEDNRQAAYPLTVVGHSLGGIIARMALKDLEANSGHNVGTYISYEVPHNGVQVPHGIQNIAVAFDDYVADYVEQGNSISGFSGNLFDEIYRHFNNIMADVLGTNIQSQIAKEVVINNVFSEHNEFAMLQSQLGTSMPADTDNIAVLHGSLDPSKSTAPIQNVAGESFYLSVRGRHLFRETDETTVELLRIPFFGTVIGTKTTVRVDSIWGNMDITAYSTSPNDTSSTLDFSSAGSYVTNSVLNYDAISNPIYQNSNGAFQVPGRAALPVYSASNAVNYDDLPGSYIPSVMFRDFFAAMETIKQPAPFDTTENIFNGGVTAQWIDSNEFTFLPSTSALGLGFDYVASAPIVAADTEFSSIVSLADADPTADNYPHGGVLLNHPALFPVVSNAVLSATLLPSAEEKLFFLLNHPAVDALYLDAYASVSTKVANEVMAFREGADGMINTSDDVPFTDIADVAVPSDTIRQKLLDFASNWTAPDLVADQIALDFLNDASTTEQLLIDDVRLAALTANSIISYRNGPDGVLDTADDNPFDSIAEVRILKYVGPGYITKIRDYAER